MKVKISAEKTEDGYKMIAILPNGDIEYPQEGRSHKTKKSVYKDALAMYSGTTWRYDPIKHTINI